MMEHKRKRSLKSCSCCRLYEFCFRCFGVFAFALCSQSIVSCLSHTNIGRHHRHSHNFAQSMNILPKKSWHVRTRKNIEKVRKDEADAAIRENDRLERIAIAERESRTSFLRNQTRSAATASSTSSSTCGLVNSHPKERFDVFSGVDQGKGDIRRNRDREKEEKARTEDWEQKVGILTYLHKKEDTGQLWYLQPHEQRLGDKSEQEEERLRLQAKQHDPLVPMTKYWDQMRAKSRDANRKSGKSRRRDERLEIGQIGDRGSKDKLQELRDKRLKREEKERRRSRKMLVGDEAPQIESRVRDERTLRFNSQFNPQLARH